MKIISHISNSAFHLKTTTVMKGEWKGNFFKTNDKLCTGIHFLSQLEQGISAMLIDTLYKEDASLEYKKENDDMVALYFFISDKNIDFKLNNTQNLVGLLNYNLSVVDIGLPTEYFVEKNTGIYCISIFIKKEILKSHLGEITTSILDVETNFSSQSNSFVHLDRMSSKSWYLIQDFRKIPFDNPSYDLYFKGLVYELISNYIEEFSPQRIISMQPIDPDIKNIIRTKLILKDMAKDNFPGIDFLASKGSMSSSKYKELFTRMVGVSPGVYFSNTKLHLAMELLASKEYTINEIADRLNYYSVTYFGRCFKKKFGIYPKEYQILL